MDIYGLFRAVYTAWKEQRLYKCRPFCFTISVYARKNPSRRISTFQDINDTGVILQCQTREQEWYFLTISE